MPPQSFFVSKQIAKMMRIIHTQELFPQPPNKLPKSPPNELHPLPLPKKSNTNKAIMIIHTLLSCKNLKSSIINASYIIKVNMLEILI